ncbi:CRTAC1 family protein [Bacillus haynesii]|uniref:CRTAC1 family protein n=2 Tax=Bacillus haynesii TaxID=1925021 RepID=UPI00227E6F00|nr:CRTAC1 family protein [Bacillus haynesii]MCY8577999.1 CRTAC1 family protein [Bacillus haynesii]MCY8668967.1 CRTAC1 family protein [Bacillus haynesii]MCY8713691.1 CRTAC1 family protein [Bacillus haynesii]MCY8741306.1 CRTAC1 family protein [Bacillus haynesii]MCY9319010.1 CRTAC1 family protein [Bacillus haynesii]
MNNGVEISKNTLMEESKKMKSQSKRSGWKKSKSFLQKHLNKLIGVFVVGSLYLILYNYQYNKTNASSVKQGDNIKFDTQVLDNISNNLKKDIREVNPSLKHIDAWISSVGASAAINDLNSDTVSDDICLVDPRYNSVSIYNSNNKYSPFELNLNEIDGYDDTMAPMGCLPGDVNEDGKMDIVIYFWGRPPVAFVRNGDAELNAKSFVINELGNPKERWFTNAATFADLDGDGHKDLIIGNYFADGARILDTNASTIEEMQDSMSRATNGGENKFLLFEDKGPVSVTYKEMKNILPKNETNGWTLAVGAADLNGDSLPELYFANDFGKDRMYLNKSKPGELNFKLLEGKSDLAIPKSDVLGHDSFKGMGVDFADIDNDGLLDIYVSNIADDYALLESHFLFRNTGDEDSYQNGIAPFKNESTTLGLSQSSWGWDSKLIDIDNNGDREALQATGFIKGTENKWAQLQELAMSNDSVLKDPAAWPDITSGDDLSGHAHNPIFKKNQSGKFIDIAKSIGMGEQQITRGIASGDVNSDGKIDLVYANQWEDSKLYINKSEKVGSSFTIRFLHPTIGENLETKVIKNNKNIIKGVDVIGLTATMELNNGEKLIDFIDGGNGHSGKRSYEIHFGTGDETEAKTINLRWRSLNGDILTDSITVEPGNYVVQLKTN